MEALASTTVSPPPRGNPNLKLHNPRELGAGTGSERLRGAASLTPFHSPALPRTLKGFNHSGAPMGSIPAMKRFQRCQMTKLSWGQTLFIVCNAPGSITQGLGGHRQLYNKRGGGSRVPFS